MHLEQESYALGINPVLSVLLFALDCALERIGDVIRLGVLRSKTKERVDRWKALAEWPGR